MKILIHWQLPKSGEPDKIWKPCSLGSSLYSWEKKGWQVKWRDQDSRQVSSWPTSYLPCRSFYYWSQGASAYCHILWPPWHRGHWGHWHRLSCPGRKGRREKERGLSMCRNKERVYATHPITQGLPRDGCCRDGVLSFCDWQTSCLSLIAEPPGHSLFLRYSCYHHLFFLRQTKQFPYSFPF